LPSREREEMANPFSFREKREVVISTPQPLPSREREEMANPFSFREKREVVISTPCLCRQTG
jgi:hypothetical protein